DNNAFTNNDITNYYDVVPKENLEIALWLESDRMLKLDINEDALDVQRKVVLEEFKETCLNKPYGDVWHHLSALVYQKHPYRWPTIGIVPKHIEDASMQDVQAFYKKYYAPNNAIAVVAGNVTEIQVRHLAEKWFSNIPAGEVSNRQLPVEPKQTKSRRLEVRADVPIDAIYMAFRMPDRLHSDYYTIDLISDVLCSGSSSRLYRRLVREQELFSFIDCYITGTIDAGLLIVEGKPSSGVSLEQAEQAIWEQLEALKNTPIANQELQKIKNKVESNLIFAESSVLNKAINLAFFEVVGDLARINDEVEYYRKIEANDIQRLAQQILASNNCSILHYKSKAKDMTAMHDVKPEDEVEYSSIA
ncbi:MAG: pitrilysin family protein, partial [Bacteroidota bacterium]